MRQQPHFTRLAKGTLPMKIAALVARLLLGLMFTVFGLNGFLHFLPQPPMGGLAGDFGKVMSESHYFAAVFAVQLIAGLLLLSGQYIPLALTIIAPVIVNILLFHILMAPAGIGPGILVTILWLVVFAAYRASFAGILQRTPPPTLAESR